MCLSPGGNGVDATPPEEDSLSGDPEEDYVLNDAHVDDNKDGELEYRATRISR